MRQCLLSVSAFLVAAVAVGAQQPWQPVGLGGGGGMFAMAVSPLDPRLMMINCDMSAAYVSHDAGRTWQMINYRMMHGNTRCCPEFHPTIRDRVYAVSGGNNELRISDDAGITWRRLLKEKAPWRDPITLLHAPKDFPESLLVGAGEAAYLSRDGGATWRRCEGVVGTVVGVVDSSKAAGASAGQPYNFIGTSTGIFRSVQPDQGYAPCVEGLPKATITGFSGGFRDGALRLYATVDCSLVQGRLSGGVYVSEDAGTTWHSCMRGGLNVETQRSDKWAKGDIPQYRFIATTDVDPQRVYVYCAGTSYWPPNHSTVYRSDDGGKNWTAVLFLDPRFAKLKLYNVEDDYFARQWKQREQGPPRSMVLCRGNPEVIAMCTSAWALRSDDGGRKWRVCHSGPAVAGDRGGDAWLCNGLVVTSTWNYYVDPHQPKRHYICYTDLGFARSLDAGKSWIWQALSLPWKNTVYELALDPDVPGRMWAAGSNTHDIPNNNVISGRHRVRMEGGVAQSDDFGITWKKLALPAAPCLSVVLDPTSPKERRVLYASLFEKGVYKSTDGGKSWSQASHGLGHPQNMRCCKLQRAADGSLLVLITGKKIGGELTRDGVGLYRSTDTAASWTKINGELTLRWPKDFSIKPDDPQTILLSAADSRGHAGAGGLYRTTDGGRTWKKVVQKEREHFGAFYHPSHPGWIYATCTEGARDAGLYLSRDDGATWEPFTTLPFRNIQRVTFDPGEPQQIIVTTFGGSVWRGPAEP